MESGKCEIRNEKPKRNLRERERESERERMK